MKSEDEIEGHLQALRKQYYDARHVCYAWRLGPDGKRFRANDDGEPSNSAGTPILNEMRSQEITEALVAVIRYFGGTKLGVGGLIRAYGTAAKEALEDAGKLEIIQTETIEIRFPYELTAEVNRTVHPFRIEPATSNYGLDCHLIYEVRLDLAPAVKEAFRTIRVLVEDEEE